MVKSNAAKEARVAKNEGAFRLVKNKMVMLLWSKAGCFDAQFSGHAEMNADPIGVGKFEEHLLSPGFRTKKAGAGELADEGPRVFAAKDALPWMKFYSQNVLPKAGIPLPAIIFNLSELGHGGK